MNKQFKIMEMTIEKKEKRKEYMRGYREENREKLNAYSREYYKNHKEYYQNYYLENKDRILMNHKLWVDQKSIDSIYCFRNIDGKVLYWGSSSRFQERISAHCTANSHLKISAENMVSEWFLDKIEYQNYSKYNLSREDLYYLECIWKSKEKEILKTAEVNFNEDKLTRSKEALEELADNVEFVEFDKLDKYLN